MSSPATERQVADWLVALGKLTTFNGSAEDAASSIRAYVPELIQRYDTRDFDRTSREFVARHCKFFPSYGELCELLDKWPKPPEKRALPALDATDLDATDRAWLAHWHKRKAEIWAQQTGFVWGSREADLASLGSLVHGQSPKAWREITGEVEPERAAPTEREIKAVADSLQRFHQRWQKSANPAPAPVKPRERPVSPERLEELRAARGVRT